MYEIDLHFMCSETALKLFIEKYNNIYRSGYRGEIKIIHGYGSSSLNSTDIIRQRIRSFLLRNKENLKMRIDINQGVTYVTPIKILPYKFKKWFFYSKF